ncbi:piggyBac transposable element-derived protein 4 [Aplysia californica]|uniref:PiggyBac transposable element-derived protein 4 n=1 Tax=Aplysia californica TaxID=6500 RepID=A0ABM0JBU9_APLCA|nr:piggyBac transposable element-derived protein 4 [Aplysia californica]
MIHVCEPREEGKAKIEPFIKALLKNFQPAFYPFQTTSVDEMVIGWKGRFLHKQYNAMKRRKHNIKTFGICDSTTGYIYNLLVYFGKDTSYIPESDEDSSQAVKVFKTLMEPLRHSGHIFTDRYYYYTSVPLITYHLSSARHYYTGTLNVNKSFFPPQLKTLRLKHLEEQYFYHEERDILCVTRKDKKAKKPCIMVATNFRVGSTEIREGCRQVSNPVMIQDYTNYTNGSDRATR